MYQDLHVSPETMKTLKEKMKRIILGTGMGENSLDKTLHMQRKQNRQLGLQENKRHLC